MAREVLGAGLSRWHCVRLRWRVGRDGADPSEAGRVPLSVLPANPIYGSTTEFQSPAMLACGDKGNDGDGNMVPGGDVGPCGVCGAL